MAELFKEIEISKEVYRSTIFSNMEEQARMAPYPGEDARGRSPIATDVTITTPIRFFIMAGAHIIKKVKNFFTRRPERSLDIRVIYVDREHSKFHDRQLTCPICLGQI